MGRTQAKKTIDEAALKAALVGTHTRPSRGYLDEAPQAYKDLDTVLHNQSDLVEPVARLRPIMNVKGAGKVKRDRSRDKDDPVQTRKREGRERGRR